MRKILFILTSLMLATSGAAQLRVSGLKTTPRATVQPAQHRVTMQPVQQRVSGLSTTQRPLGYTSTDSITVSGAAFGTAGTYTIGATLTPDQLLPYQGCTVVGVRFALSQSVGRTRAFICNVNGNDVTPVVEQNQRTYAGWNNVFFNGASPYVITGNESLFFGFDYVESAEMVAADEGALALFGEEDVDNSFCLYGNYGNGVGLYSVTGGVLCVQLIVDVSNLPEKELNFNYFDAGFRYKKPGDLIEFLAGLNNTGRSAVTSYVVGCQLGNLDPVYFDVNTDDGKTLAEGATTYCEQAFTIPETMPAGYYDFAVFVHSVDGVVQSRHLNDTVCSKVSVYTSALPRQQHLIEMYTHEQSPYVPFVDPCFEKVVQQNSNACMVNIAAPTTILALDEANYLHDLYAYTYPSFTLDRSYFPGEAYIAYDVNDYVLAIPDLIPSMIGDMLLQEDLNPAFASVTLSPSWQSAGRELTVNVSGEVADDAAALFGDLALTVMLTEDKVVARQMTYNAATGRSSWNQNYQHDHVLRTYLTAPLGDKLTVSDGHYTAQYQLSLPDDWKAEDLSVIAFVTRAAETVTDDNVMSMDITNANSVSLADIVTGIEDATLARPWSLARARIDNGQWTTDNIVVYDLQGRKLSTIHYPFSTSEAPFASLPRGVYVVKQGKKVKKIMKQ